MTSAPVQPHASMHSCLETAATTITRIARETSRLLAGSLDKLNFGCGPHPMTGWTNIDNGDGVWYDAPESRHVIKLDIFEALDALPDACAACVYSEHLFEHFSLEDGHRLLREWFRVLKPGGVVRIVCPDLETEAKLFLRQVTPAPDDVIDRHRLRWLGGRYGFQEGETLTRAMVLNYSMWLDGHKFIYDEETIRQSLRLAGFEQITRERFGHSTHAALNAVDSHDGGETGQSWIPSIALVMEATRRGVTRPPALRVSAPIKNAGGHMNLPAHGVDTMKRRLVELTADVCAARGYRRIALYGAGQHTAGITREPWLARGVQVVAVLDDAPKTDELSGVRVCTPTQLAAPIDAVVISSDAHEGAIAARAALVFADQNMPILTIYAGDARQKC